MMNAQPKPKLPMSAAFEKNAFYEKVLDLRRTNLKAFEGLAPVTKLALGAYEAQKREAERLQAIRDDFAARVSGRQTEAGCSKISPGSAPLQN